MTNTAARGADEAVLDSIRRLLSDGRAPEPKPESRPPVNEKLLLTPALRVETAPAAPAPRPRSEPVAWSLEDRIAELEAAVGDQPGEWEPDGSEDAEQERPSRFVFQHRAAPLGAAAPGMAEAAAPAPRAPELASAVRADIDDDDAADDGFDIFEDDRLPDPDALRDLVAEIVRQELQSDLGQRVTRNIRKLVRREIRRALAARDFD
ncbi:MAG: hypothetical protein MUF63_01400 [Rhodobacteraceae bacterium]|jgi:hypothetical protein|nr:hypothetical protein [Paracoccaceae bacterium]